MKYLRAWLLEDASDIARILNNVNVQNNLRDGIPFPYTEEDAKMYLRSVFDAPADTIYDWAIINEGEVVGSITAFRQANIHYRTAEIGYYLSEACWGRGIATKAVK